MNGIGGNRVGPDREGPREKGDLIEAIHALMGRLGEVAQGPEAQQVKTELETRAREVGQQIDDTLEGPQAQALKKRVAALIRAIQQQVR